MVGEEGLEPSRSCDHGILSPVRLPIPPFSHIGAPCWLHSNSTQPHAERADYTYKANGCGGLDLNQRPSGYEPDELPSCSTPRYIKVYYAPDQWLVLCYF